MVVGASLAPTFDSFTTFRALQGLFGTVPQIIGLPIIHDVYSPRDWPSMINIWATTFLVGPFLGPALAGYLMQATGSWRAAFGVLAGLYCLSTCLVVAFARETYYNKATRTQRVGRLEAFLGRGNTGLAKLRTVIESSKLVFGLAFFRIPLLLVGLASLVNFTWPIGITTTISTILHSPPYLFDNVEDASMRFAGVIGALLGFVLGYGFNEWIFRSRTRRANWRTELRLHGVWLPVLSLVCGLLTYGLTLHYGKSWLGLASGWIMVNIGLIASTV
jgi:MFS family permease